MRLIVASKSILTENQLMLNLFQLQRFDRICISFRSEIVARVSNSYEWSGERETETEVEVVQFSTTISMFFHNQNRLFSLVSLTLLCLTHTLSFSSQF